MEISFLKFMLLGKGKVHVDNIVENIMVHSPSLLNLEFIDKSYKFL